MLSEANVLYELGALTAITRLDALDIHSQVAQDVQESTNDGDDGYDFSTPDFTKAEAHAVLVANEELTDADAEYALDFLYRRGHIYYVDEGAYITPTDD